MVDLTSKIDTKAVKHHLTNGTLTEFMIMQCTRCKETKNVMNVFFRSGIGSVNANKAVPYVTCTLPVYFIVPSSPFVTLVGDPIPWSTHKPEEEL